MPKQQAKRKASSKPEEPDSKKVHVETDAEREEREDREEDERAEQQGREEECWRVAFRDGQDHMPFAQPYRIHENLRWFYSDIRRNRFPHGGETVANARCHDTLMLKYHLYRFGMPRYLDEGGALAYTMRKEVLACRCGNGGKFSEVEKWYQHGKQTHWPDFDYLDQNKPDDVKYVERYHVKNQIFDGLWTEPAHKFPTLALTLISDLLDQELIKVLWWDLPKELLDTVADFIPLTDSLEVAKARKYRPADPEANLYRLLLSAVLGDGLLILMEGQHEGDSHSSKCGMTPFDLVDARLEVGSVITRVRPTCTSWLPHGASYNLPRDKKTECTIVIHHVQPEVKTVVVQEIEKSRGHGGYWGEGDILMQPGVRLQVTKIDNIKTFESFHTDRSSVCTRRGPVRIVHTLVSL